MAGSVRLQIDYNKLRRFSRERAYAIMRLTVTEVRLTARRNVLYRKYPGFPNPRPIGLANSIYGVFRTSGSGYIGRVGSNLSYAASVEFGAEAHIIRPRPGSLGGGFYFGGYRRLYFYWHKVNRYVAPRMVHHPGQRGKHYLRDALFRVGRRRGFKVVIYK